MEQIDPIVKKILVSQPISIRRWDVFDSEVSISPTKTKCLHPQLISAIDNLLFFSLALYYINFMQITDDIFDIRMTCATSIYTTHLLTRLTIRQRFVATGTDYENNSIRNMPNQTFGFFSLIADACMRNGREITLFYYATRNVFQ